MVKKIIKDITPPIIWNKLKKFKKTKYGWSGNYKSWAKALKDSKGYDSDIIIEKVSQSLLKVKNGEAIFERDSVLLREKEFSFPLLTTLLLVSSSHELKLNLIDFGGSLGSSYFQCRDFLQYSKSIRWNIIEQKNFVEYGKNNFENEILKFYFDLDSCLKSTSPNLFMLCSTLQYLEKPFELLELIKKLNFEYLFFDRTSFWDYRDTITIQKVSPNIYEASYPCWIFNLANFKNYFEEQYENLFYTPSIYSKLIVNGKPVRNMAFLFKHK